jgi:acyl transferase domain-containing protein/NADPH:quinone reductase-like Zn-dependent oxidoreductase/NADP-dependent 3-hydroxy acid dehydrogenase YdfG/acyl carrier protein
METSSAAPEYHRQHHTAVDVSSDAIAIIGMGCRFPGEASNPDHYWKMLVHGLDAVSDIPHERWDISRFYDPNPDKPGKAYVKQAAFLRQSINEFDALFFGISPREAQVIDPQQRLLLEVSWEALEDAGIIPAKLAGSNTGIYIGAFTTDHILTQLGVLNRELIGNHTVTSMTMTLLSNRLSYFYDLHGPSITIDTACSSSLVSIHQACRALLNKECNLALAGGVNIMSRPELVIAMSKGQLLAKDGRCKTFDASADGYGRGEGAGVLALKTLASAIQDRDRIHAIIRGTGVNQDGRTEGITLPNPKAQKELIKQVLKQAKVNPKDVSYIEAHGTGTAAGDPRETESLGKVIGKDRPGDTKCLIGSVKANIGHLEAASGVAGVIKAVLCLKHELVPPQISYRNPNPAIPFNELGLKVPQKPEPLPQKSEPHIAVVNSFGYGGTNAHLILEQWKEDMFPEEEKETSHTSCAASNTHLLMLSAPNTQALIHMAKRYIDLLGASKAKLLKDICYSSLMHRSHFSYRVFVAAETLQEMLERLNRFVAGENDQAVLLVKTESSENIAKKPVFVFTGMGPQWWAMGRELLKKDNKFLEMAKKVDRIFRKLAGWSILKEVLQDREESQISKTSIAQPANLLIQVCLTDWWRRHGVQPSAIVGHSVGEVTAAWASGVLTLEEAVQVSYHRSRLQELCAGNGGMLAAELNRQEAEVIISSLALNKVSIAAINSPSSLTLAGDSAALDQIAEKLEAEGIFNRFLTVEVPYHSPQMDTIKEDLLKCLARLKPKAPKLPLYSTVQGGLAKGIVFDAQYWCDNVREPVYFSDAINALATDGYSLFLEVGPHPVLGVSIKQCFQELNKEGALVASLNRHQKDDIAILLAFGSLWSKCSAGDLASITKTSAKFVDLPTYPWQRIWHWTEGEDAAEDRLGIDSNGLLGRRLNQPEPEWELFVNDQAIEYLPDHHVEHNLVLPGASYVEAGLAIDREIYASDSVTITNMKFDRALVVDTDDEPKLRMKYDEEKRMFSVYSKSPLPGAQWIKHASGYISHIKELRSTQVPLEDIRSRCLESVNARELYEQLEQRGLRYGLMFQGIVGAVRAECEVLSEIDCSKAGSASTQYRLAPPVLDACFQSLILTLDSNSGDSDVYIPISIGAVHFFESPQGSVLCHGLLRERGDDFILGDLTLCNEEGKLLVEVCDVRCQLISDGYNVLNRLNEWSYIPDWQSAKLKDNIEQSPDRLLVFINGPTGEQIADKLEHEDMDMVRVTAGQDFEKRSKNAFQIRSGNTSDLKRLMKQDVVSNCTKSLYLSFLDTKFSEADPVSNSAGLELLHTIQTLTTTVREKPMRLFFVSLGAQQTGHGSAELNLAHTPLIGLVRVAANEYPDNQCTLIDLDADADEPSYPHLISELRANDKELEVCFRGNERLIYRLVRADIRSIEKSYTDDLPEHTVTYEPYRMELRERGSSETLQLRRVNRHIPGAREVELQIKAISVPDSLTDVLLNDLPLTGDPSGGTTNHIMTVSATVLSVGEQVSKYSVGDNIMAVVPALPATHIMIAEESIFPRPGLLTSLGTRDTGQFLPLLSAYYGLVELARMQSGDRILIHKADSSDGLAAACIAKHFGAKVYATADREDAFSFLRNLDVDLILPTKSLKFVRDIKALAGEVDIVFNAFNKEVACESQKLLAIAGRFVDTMDFNNQDNFYHENAENKSISYYYVNLPLLLQARPSSLNSAVKAVNELLLDCDFPRLPVRVLSIQQLSKLFVCSETKTSLGERVLMLDTPSRLLPPLNDRSIFKHDVSYLITGGFGGFGGAVARWMIQRGARHLVLVGRRGIRTPGARELITDLESFGAVIEPVAADLSKHNDVSRMFFDLQKKNISISGVMHAAGVLDDAVLPEITDEKYLHVVSPKSLAAWYIHQHTLNDNLDFMVLFSSITTLIGNPGQANYVAANTWLDVFAHYRRANGLAATSINWGLIADVGFGVRNQDIVKHFDRLGISGLPPRQALDCLEYVMRWNSVQYGIADMAWERLFGIHNPRFAQLRNTEGNSALSSMHTELVEMDSEGRENLIIEVFCDYVASTLELLPDQVNPDNRLNDLGLDSLVAVELLMRIQTGFGVEMTILELMKDQSISQMSLNVLRKMGMNA